MSVIAAAIVTASVVGAGSAIYSANKNAAAVEEGIKAQTETSAENMQLQQELAETQREDFAPWREQGELALQQITEGIESGRFTQDKFVFDFKSDPGYQFRMDQGIKALDRSASARGRLQSGAQEKALTEYGQNFASNEYGKAYGRAANEYLMESDRKAKDFNILSSLTSKGQASAAGQAGATSKLATTTGNVLSNLGYSQNQAAQNIGSAYADAGKQVAGSVNQGIQNWVTYDYLNS